MVSHPSFSVHQAGMCLLSGASLPLRVILTLPIMSCEIGDHSLEEEVKDGFQRACEGGVPMMSQLAPRWLLEM